MDLVLNNRAGFTRWAVARGLLHEQFVLVDVGVQSGESLRWLLLGDHLVVHGFDAIAEVIEELRQRSAGTPGRHYHSFALGSRDEMRTFHVNELDRCSSAFEPRAATAAPHERPREVEVKRLDTLLQTGLIPPADMIKIDVEGWEKEVCDGAPNLLSGVMAMETETNFGTSWLYPTGHFCTMAAIALQSHKLPMDIAFNRVPQPSFMRALSAQRVEPQPLAEIGKPATINALFTRDLVHEDKEPWSYATKPPPVSTDGLIKLVMILELYGLCDLAVVLVEHFAAQLGTRLDTEMAVRLLADPWCRNPHLAPAGP